VFRSIESRTHFANAGLIDSVGVAVSESGFWSGNVVFGGSVLGEEFEADIAHAVVTSGTVNTKNRYLNSTMKINFSNISMFTFMKKLFSLLVVKFNMPHFLKLYTTNCTCNLSKKLKSINILWIIVFFFRIPTTNHDLWFKKVETLYYE
jgi:hypothetical protein